MPVFICLLGPESEKFFSLLANSAGHRLDDQRVALRTLPGIQNGGTTSATGGKDDLCYMVTKVQVSPICNSVNLTQRLYKCNQQDGNTCTLSEIQMDK